MVRHSIDRSAVPSFHRNGGFTIVELLIVIVVIGILAAITIVAFNGVTAKARETAMKANLSGVHRKMMTETIETNVYPVSLSAIGITATDGGTYQYTVNNSVSPSTYCVTYVKDGVGFFMNQDGQSAAGLCPGHTLSGVSPPTVTGFYDFTPLASFTDMTMPSIPDGSWMIIVMAYNDATTAVAPAGWTTLYTRTPANTLHSMVFGKIKSSSDPATFSISGVTVLNASGVLFWGAGASSNLSSWVKGSVATRDGTATAQQYLTTAPSVTTTAVQSLVLTISNERTSLAESDVTSVVGSTKWFFIPQTGNKIQSITVSSMVAANPSATAAVVTTYPNSQPTNGYSLQLALPPS